MHFHLLLEAVQKLETQEKPRVITAPADTADSSAAGTPKDLK